MAARSTKLPLSPTRLPRELIVLYAVAPLVVTPVLSSEFFAHVPHALGRDLIVNYIAFVTIPLGIHLLYRCVMPALLARCASVGWRLVIHLAATGLVTSGIALMVYPAVAWILGDGPSLLTWSVRTIAAMWVIVLPALVVQELRNRAEAGERNVLAQRQAVLRAQLEALQSRTNPHFLFNSITAVVGLIHEDPERAERTLERMADVLRYALQSSRREMVPLRDELAMIEDYLEIERARFGSRLCYTVDVEPGLGELELPPLVLQPLVENAVLHGLAGRTDRGVVRLVVRRRGAQIELRVDDDGPGLGGSRHTGSGTGLRDLTHRIELVYGDAASLTIRTGELGGVTAQLMVPPRGVL
jgi:two-component system, LytTR family, sensor histidine kinase AlgZ